MMAFYCKFDDGTFRTIWSDFEFNVWTLPGIVRCQILGG